MRIFLTGATGFIGQELVRAMRARAWDVTALVRDDTSSPSRWLSSHGVTLHRGDVTRPDGLAAAMRGVDVVLHNAGVYEYGADAALARRMRAVNVDGTATVLGAAVEAGVPRTVYVSTVWALGVHTGTQPADESKRHDGRFLTAYERSKHDAHQVALTMRARGLPLVIAIPNAVVGANDHSIFGYLLRLYLMGRLAPVAWGADAIFPAVDVRALAEGLCLAAERAPIGEDFLFCGAPQTTREIFGHWARHAGGSRHMVFLPRWLARPQMALMEPLLRAAGLPAFLSRETVDVGSSGLNYSAAKAHRMLGWPHPETGAMWDRIVAEERKLVESRRGFLERLRPQAVVPD
jgi:dihydroflavonol-4-reductase